MDFGFFIVFQLLLELEILFLEQDFGLEQETKTVKKPKSISCSIEINVRKERSNSMQFDKIKFRVVFSVFYSWDEIIQPTI